MKRYIILCAALFAGCTAIHTFTPTGADTFEPRAVEYAIEVLDTMPADGYVMLGYVDARGWDMGDAVKLLKKLARENGGSAIVDIQAENFGQGVMLYKAKLIRYTDG